MTETSEMIQVYWDVSTMSTGIYLLTWRN